MTAIATTNGQTAIARPLTILVPLIKQDLEAGSEAAKKASMPYYQAVGEKLIEAKSQMRHGEFIPWLERNLGIKKVTAAYYIKLAEAATDEKFSALNFSSMSDFIRQTGNPDYNKPHTVRPQPWHEPVKQEMKTVDTDYLDRLAEKRLAEQKERQLERELATKLIDIGYKTLATKLHPDKGGSVEAMHRLQNVKNRLKTAI